MGRALAFTALCFFDWESNVTNGLAILPPCLPHQSGLYPWTASQNNLFRQTLCHSKRQGGTNMPTMFLWWLTVIYLILLHSWYFISFLTSSPPAISSQLDLSHPPSGTVPHSVIVNYWMLASSSLFREVCGDSVLVAFPVSPLVLLTPVLMKLIVIALRTRHCFSYLFFIVCPPHVHSSPLTFHRRSQFCYWHP